MRTLVFLFLIIVATPAALCAGGAVTDWRTSIKPDAMVDLRSDSGAALVNTQWRVRSSGATRRWTG